MARTPLTRPWADEELAELQRLMEAGATPRAAALRLRRSVTAVRSKIRKFQASDQKQTRMRAGRPAEDQAASE
jgi:hypothetical protein